MIRDVNSLHLDPQVDYIDGQTLTPMVKLHASISNPNTHEPLQQQRATADTYLDNALAAAERVHRTGVWRSMAADERAQRLEQMADELENRLEDIAAVEALTTGVVIRQTRALARLVPLSFRNAARQARQGGKSLSLSTKVDVQRVPWGPAVLLTPWSASAVSTAHKIASALAAGCPVILKASEWSPHAAGIVAGVITRVDLPTGVFQLVHGGADVGMRLVQDPRCKVVSFSGGAVGGRAVAQACAADFKPAQLELYGTNPMLVLEDADLDLAAEGVVTALIALNGQWNRGLSRLLVHRSMYHGLLSRVLERLEAVTVGDSLSSESDMGPLIHMAHFQDIQQAREALLAQGGVMHVNSKMPDLPGYFMEPSLITNCQPEDTGHLILGPVVPVHMFKDDAEAVELANQPNCGSIAYIYSGDEGRARRLARDIEVASISINGVSLFGLHPQAPRSGWGGNGLGEAGVIETFRFFTGTRATGVGGS